MDKSNKAPQINCPACGSKKVVRKGQRNGHQGYRCRSCSRKFRANDPREPVHFAPNPPCQPYACGLTGYPEGPTVRSTNDPEMVRGCVVCEAEAIARMATSEKNLHAIFMGCGCELTSYTPREGPGVVMVPHSCIRHGGYIIGEHPDEPEYSVILASDEEVRQIWDETLRELQEPN